MMSENILPQIPDVPEPDLSRATWYDILYVMNDLGISSDALTIDPKYELHAARTVTLTLGGVVIIRVTNPDPAELRDELLDRLITLTGLLDPCIEKDEK